MEYYWVRRLLKSFFEWKYLKNVRSLFSSVGCSSLPPDILTMYDHDEGIMLKAILKLEPSFSLLVVITFCVSAFTVVILLFDLFVASPDSALRKTHFFVLYEYNVRRVFTAQSTETLNTLMFGVRTILGNQCERPCVLLFLATSETHCTALALAKKIAQTIVVSFENELPVEKVGKTVMRGSKYTSFENYWDFHRGLSKRMEQYKVVIVNEFQTIHPHVATVLSNLADDTFSPFPQAVIILILDTENYFSHKELAENSPISLSEIYTEHITSAFLDNFTMKELQRCTCGRAVLINKEKSKEI